MAMEAAKPLGGQQRFMIVSLFLIFFVCVLALIHELRYETLSNFGRCALSNTPQLNDYSTNLSAAAANSSPSDDEIRILIGVLTLPNQYHRRHFLRIIYGTQSPAGARVDVKFVFCSLTNEEHQVLVAVEIMRYDDIIILNCTENMNKGKTYAYFSSLPEMLKGEDRPYPPYHYVMKADDDTFFRLEKLVASLRPLPREDLYYGFVIPCRSMDPFVRYMSGMGYMVSWDLVEWISKSDIARNHTEGPEDLVFGSWLRDGRRAKNRYNAKWAMYNYPEPKDPCQHEFWPDTIAVHLVKTPEKWFRTLKYFNFTSNLKPSKLYHIP